MSYLPDEFKKYIQASYPAALPAHQIDQLEAAFLAGCAAGLCIVSEEYVLHKKPMAITILRLSVEATDRAVLVEKRLEESQG